MPPHPRLRRHYNNDKLSLALPFHASNSGSGRLLIQLLDPEDHVVGRRPPLTLHSGDGIWRGESLIPRTPSPTTT